MATLILALLTCTKPLADLLIGKRWGLRIAEALFGPTDLR